MHFLSDKPRIPVSIFVSVLYVSIFLFFGLFFTGVPGAEDKDGDNEKRLSVSLSHESASIGSIVTLTLEYRLPEGAHLPQEIKVQGLDDMTVVDQGMESGRIRISILVDRLGEWKTDRLGLVYIDADGKKRILKADPVSLTVISNLGKSPEKARLRPIQDIIPTNPVWLEYLLWSFVALLILVASFSLIWWYRKGKGRNDSRIVQEPPHILAKKEIDMLVAQRLFENGHIKPFYFRLSGIIRRYLESLRGFPAAEFTTEEIARAIDNERDRTLLPLLRQADLVKFSDSIPTQARKDEDVKAAISFIEDTAPTAELSSESQDLQSSTSSGTC